MVQDVTNSVGRLVPAYVWSTLQSRWQKLLYYSPIQPRWSATEKHTPNISKILSYSNLKFHIYHLE